MLKLALIIKSALYENNNLSLTRVIALLSFILFAIVSLYLVVKGQSWGNYDTFAMIAGGGGAVTQVANKYVNGKYNTMPHSYMTAEQESQQKKAINYGA